LNTLGQIQHYARVNVSKKNQKSIDSLLHRLAMLNNFKALNVYFHPIYALFNGDSADKVNPSVVSTVSENTPNWSSVHKLLVHLDLHSLGLSSVANASLFGGQADGLMIDPSGRLLKCDHEFGVPSESCGHVETV